MTDRPIIFSAPMVRALLDGRKTQTRRVLKPQPPAGLLPEGIAIAGEAQPTGCGYRLGDRLWVREAFRGDKGYDAYPPQEWSRWPVHYEADGNRDTREGMGADGRLRPSIHMPRWASRITLTVTDVRVQRLQDISEADAVAEGADVAQLRMYPELGNARHWFRALWNDLHGADAWERNPWVVALTFTVQRGNIDQVAACAS